MAPTFAPPPATQRRAFRALLIALALLALTGPLTMVWLSFGTPSADLMPMAAQTGPFSISAGEVGKTYEGLLRTHWSPKTGLFLSFPGTSDNKLAQQAATYDQAVIGLLSLEIGDVNRVHRMIQFFTRAWYEGPRRPGVHHRVYGLANFYNAFFGGEGIEKTIHLGPNAWVGLFAARAANRTGDANALHLAKIIADWARTLPMDRGGRAMGSVVGLDGVPWNRVYSTENNISYWAFLNELAKSPRIDEGYRQSLKAEQDRVERWLMTVAYDPASGEMLRGVNPMGRDHVRALDTYTWLLPTLGVERLHKWGLDPVQLIRFADAKFIAPVDGLLAVDCTDADEAYKTHRNERSAAALRPIRNNYRLQWIEGQNQMILAMLYMKEALLRRSPGMSRSLRSPSARHALFTRLDQQSRRLMESVDARASNPQYRGATICATDGRFFKDGWPGPSSSNLQPATALAGSVWRLFSKLRYEPLTGAYLLASRPVTLAGVPSPDVHARGNPTVLYGAAQEMTVHAWKLFDQGDLNGAARQALATIREWQEWAIDLQKQKQKEVGDYVVFDGTLTSAQKIHRYWGLNDVAACYYILAKIADSENHFEVSRAALRTIREKLALAQVWDRKGWFWGPTEAMEYEFLRQNPAKYGELEDRLQEGFQDAYSLPAAKPR